MNKIGFLTLGLSILPCQLAAQNDTAWQLSTLGGVFAPNQTELQSIYGNGFAGSLQAAVKIGASGRLQAGFDRFQRRGDPFYRSAEFDAGNAAELTLTGLSFTLQSHALTRGYPRLYFGAGLDYVFAREKIREQGVSKGQTVGAHFSLTPELRLSRRLFLVANASYRFIEVTFKNDRSRYTFDLSGTSLLVGLAFAFSATD